jgi:hypothetical protein
MRPNGRLLMSVKRRVSPPWRVSPHHLPPLLDLSFMLVLWSFVQSPPTRDSTVA